MKTYTEIIQEMYSLNLRKDERWGYTFVFTEGNYKFDLHDHSTGVHLRIYMVLSDGEELRIYDMTTWYYPQYEFNNNGKTLGFQHDGPWVTQIAELMRGFEEEIEREKARRMAREREIPEEAARKEFEKVEKFKKLVGV